MARTSSSSRAEEWLAVSSGLVRFNMKLDMDIKQHQINNTDSKERRRDEVISLDVVVGYKHENNNKQL